MSTAHWESPGSPPGLSTSKSSQTSTNDSSSTASSASSQSDHNAIDIKHFEDIGLDDDSRSLAVPASAPASVLSFSYKYPLTRLANGSDNSRPMRPFVAQRPTSMPKSPQFAQELTIPKLKSRHARPVPQSLRLRSQSSYQTDLTSRRLMARNISSPSLAVTAMSNYTRSRSPSPNPAISPAHPFFAQKSTRLHRHGDNSRAPQLPIRRGSWQPSRKSVKELEAECVDEDDDDLPDDASLWNVPISPRPLSERSRTMPTHLSAQRFSSASTPSSRGSPSVSPERPSPLRRSMGSDGTISSPAAASTFMHSSPVSNQYSPSCLGSSPMSRSDNAVDWPQRSYSWNVALSDLSSEAKALTQSLEDHHLNESFATRKLRRDSTPSSSSRRPVGELHLQRAKTASSIELPPLRVNNVMIDPLPISKEKEAVLSRTRPSWLPPKPRSEERRHLREYQKMLSQSQQAEKQRNDKAQSTRCAKDKTQAALLKVWEDHVIPNWQGSIKETATRDLYWKGVPAKVRGKVWAKAIGNDLGLTANSYHRALARAQAAQDGASSSSSTAMFRQWFDMIDIAVSQTFTNLHIFQAPHGPLHKTLTSILRAYSMYRQDIGFPDMSKCIHLHAAFLLLHLPSAEPEPAFIALANLLNRPLPLAFLTSDDAGMQKAYDLTITLLERKVPRLCKHLFASSGSSTLDAPQPAQRQLTTKLQPTVARTIFHPLFTSLFLSPSLISLDTAARIWDVFLLDGDFAIIRAAATILGSVEGRLYASADAYAAQAVLCPKQTDTGIDPRQSPQHTEAETVVTEREEDFILRMRSMGRSGPSVDTNKVQV